MVNESEPHQPPRARSRGLDLVRACVDATSELGRVHRVLGLLAVLTLLVRESELPADYSSSRTSSAASCAVAVDLLAVQLHGVALCFVHFTRCP